MDQSGCLLTYRKTLNIRKDGHFMITDIGLYKAIQTNFIVTQSSLFDTMKINQFFGLILAVCSSSPYIWSKDLFSV